MKIRQVLDVDTAEYAIVRAEVANNTGADGVFLSAPVDSFGLSEPLIKSYNVLRKEFPRKFLGLHLRNAKDGIESLDAVAYAWGRDYIQDMPSAIWLDTPDESLEELGASLNELHDVTPNLHTQLYARPENIDSFRYVDVLTVTPEEGDPERISKLYDSIGRLTLCLALPETQRDNHNDLLKYTDELLLMDRVTSEAIATQA